MLFHFQILLLIRQDLIIYHLLKEALFILIYRITFIFKIVRSQIVLGLMKVEYFEFKGIIIF